MNESNGSSGANNSGNNGGGNNKDTNKNSSQVVVTNDNIPSTPCEPGTKVLMEGIVWHETDSGMLVVNVTWRNKTYIGTLLDSTKYTWSAPRMIDNESGSESKSATRGRKKQYTRASFNHATTERKTRRSQLAAQSAMDMSTEKSRGKKSKSKNSKSKKKETAPVVEDHHDEDESNNGKKGGKKGKDDDRATPKSKKVDETSDNDSKKKKTGQRSNTPVVNKDEDYHPKKRYKQTPKYTEEEENQPAKKRKNAKNDSKSSDKKGKTLRSNTPTEQPSQQRNTSNDNDTGVKSPNFNRHIPPSMPNLSYNGSSKKTQVAVNSKNTRIPPPLQRGPPLENEDMDVDMPENTNKPKPKELAKIVENNSPVKRISPAYSDISDANEESNSPVLGQNSTAQSNNQPLGPPPKLVSRPKLPNSTAQPQPKSDARASPSSTRLPGTPGENQFFHGKVERNNLMTNENKQSESDIKDKVQNQSNVMKPPYPQMKQSPLVQNQQLPKPNNLMAGQKVADQITREAAQQKQHTVQNMHRISNQQPRHQNYNPKHPQFNRGPPQSFPRPNNSGNFVHPNNRHSGYSSSTASAAIAATQRGYGNNMGVPMQKR